MRSVGRFAQADSVIPASQGTQAWDRYAFVNNNPVRYTDPTGHMIDSGGGTTCYEETEDCSVTHTVLAGMHNWMTPYVPGPDESGCDGCSAEGQYPASAWASAPDVLLNQPAIWIRNNQAANGDPSIFTFVTYDEYLDGTISVDSITVYNKSNVELAVSSVTFGVEVTPCQTLCYQPSNQTYSVNRTYWQNPGAPSPGVGTIPGKSITTVSLTPSGNNVNPTNSWGSSYNVSVVIKLAMYLTGERYAPIIFPIP
ncbi:MAG TPA: hypothetical protein PKC99_18900 [Anaerolineales bacterium]|nr:hypothetical protein [Anaerolineales bacterium]